MDIGALVHDYGYWAVAFFCFLEGETVLVLAGFACQQGQLDLGAVIAIGAACGWAGDQCFFWIGRRFGAPLVARLPWLQRKAARLQRLVERYADWVIVLVRFAYGLRIAGPVLIGTTRVGAARFAAFNALGAALWAGIVAGAGWLFGAAMQRLLGSLKETEGWILGALLAAGAAAFVIGSLRGRRRG